jgi:hypothetical protein
MDLLRYIETRAGRDRIVRLLEPVTLVGGVIVSAVLFGARFL